MKINRLLQLRNFIRSTEHMIIATSDISERKITRDAYYPFNNSQLCIFTRVSICGVMDLAIYIYFFFFYSWVLFDMFMTFLSLKSLCQYLRVIQFVSISISISLLIRLATTHVKCNFKVFSILPFSATFLATRIWSAMMEKTGRNKL